MAEIDAYAPDLVVLAGYMRILSPAFVSHYQGRLLNIHPSLLPKYPGLHTHRQVLENGDEEHGTSVHFVTDELDGGPVILQAKVPVFAGDSEVGQCTGSGPGTCHLSAGHQLVRRWASAHGRQPRLAG